MRPSGNEAGLMLCTHASALPDMIPPKLTVASEFFSHQFSPAQLFVPLYTINVFDRLLEAAFQLNEFSCVDKRRVSYELHASL